MMKLPTTTWVVAIATLLSSQHASVYANPIPMPHSNAHLQATTTNRYAHSFIQPRRDTDIPVAGDPCKVQSDCYERDIYCDEVAGMCKTVHGDGEKCDMWYECVEEYTCFNGTCQYYDAIDPDALEAMRVPIGGECIMNTANTEMQCKKEGYCQNGTCVARLEEGEECDATYGEYVVCKDGLVCRQGTCRTNDDKQAEGETCDDDSECQDDLFCNNSVCVEKKGEGVTCTNEFECLNELSCRRGECRTANNTVAPGEVCENWVDCPDGYNCKTPADGGESTCGKKVGEGGDCETSFDCLDDMDLSCMMKKCQYNNYTVSPGDPCDTSEMCPEDYNCDLDYGTCAKKVGLRETCDTYEACPTSAECKDGKCAAKNTNDSAGESPEPKPKPEPEPVPEASPVMKREIEVESGF